MKQVKGWMMMKKVKKKLASAVVLGLMLAVPVGVSAAEETIDIAQTNTNIEKADSDIIFKAPVSGPSLTVNNHNGYNITAANITLDGLWQGENVFLVQNKGSKLTVSTNNIVSTPLANTGGNIYFHAQGGDIVVNANNISLESDSSIFWAQKNTQGDASSITVNATGDINLVSKNGADTVGAATLTENATSSSQVTITGKNVSITSKGGTAVSASAWNWNNGQLDDNYKSSDKVTITAQEKLIITGEEKRAVGIVGGRESDKAEISLNAKQIEINGLIKSDNGKIEIGTNADFEKADITGDINANNNSDVAINLGSGSLNGAIINDDTSAVSLNMADGIWNVDGDSRLRILNGEGVIALNVDDIDNVDTVEIGDAKNADITLAAQQDADHVDDANAALAAMANAVTGLEDGTVVKIDEGILNGATQGTLEGDTVTQITTQDTTTTMGNMRDLASVALVAWRQEDSTLSQRLGELRNSEGDQGIWARMSRGEFEYDGAFKNQYNYFQMGYDWAAGDWHYGAAISHNDGQTTYAQGSGENDSTSLTLYGTWLGDKGQYTDIVVKQGKINNEYTNYAAAGVTKADYDMWGTAISAEYGQKLEMQNDWYVTPQAQLTYMRIGGEDYTASVDGKPMQVSQDGMDSFVGRIGFEAGKNISDKGSVYVKASLLHEFAGEADTYLQLGGIDNSYTQDLGDTWYECGFGVNYKTSDNSYLYADVVKTYGGDVETPWQWNAGMRWSF